jgi:hypothetical protein
MKATTRSVRRPDFAGAWYPADRAGVVKIITSYEKEPLEPAALTGSLTGGIVPHAGWFYSGRLAANVIRVLAARSRAETVVLFGGHLAKGMRPSLMPGGAWETPLGNLPVDEELASPLLGAFHFVEETALDHDQDNTTELQMPFIKHYLPEARVLAIGAPPEDVSFAIADAIAEGARALGRRIVAVGSTDLTHYGPNYGLAPKGSGPEAVRWVKEVNDRKVIERMTALDARGVREEGLRSYNACCMGAASAAVHLAGSLGATRGEVLDYYTSYDVSPNASFVGYAGVVFG